ncbi:YqeG family HAD IIIA-type phosphatase [Candidatus Woesearchaeota archaeon]|nr:YqeG family HAD IIIA-type phosphatase [Candidatus Woesearchaeota archaeon]
MGLKEIIALQWFNVPYIIESRRRRNNNNKLSMTIPHYFVHDIRCINTDVMKEMGIKAILSDLDATLRYPYADKFVDELRDKVYELKEAVNDKFYIVSNSAGTLWYTGEARVLEQKLDVKVLHHFWKKPWGYEFVKTQVSVKPDEILVIGDKRYTDILFANYLGGLSLLVMPKVQDMGKREFRMYGQERRELEELLDKGLRAPEHSRYNPDLVTTDLLPSYS